MNNYLEEILEIVGLDETLENLLIKKMKYRKKLLTKFRKVASKISLEEMDLSSFEEIKNYIDFLLIEEEIDVLDKTINKISYYLTRIQTIKSIQTISGNKWQDAQQQLDMLDIVEVVSRYAEVENPKRLIRCPIHNDKTPSFKIYQKTNSFYCFGCKQGGAPINLIMLMEGLSFKEALKSIIS